MRTDMDQKRKRHSNVFAKFPVFIFLVLTICLPFRYPRLPNMDLLDNHLCLQSQRMLAHEKEGMAMILCEELNLSSSGGSRVPDSFLFPVSFSKDDSV